MKTFREGLRYRSVECELDRAAQALDDQIGLNPILQFAAC